MINMPKFKFNINDKIKDKYGMYKVYDISYSLANGKWYYKTSYWEHGYEHYCESEIEYVDNNFEVVK